MNELASNFKIHEGRPHLLPDQPALSVFATLMRKHYLIPSTPPDRHPGVSCGNHATQVHHKHYDFKTMAGIHAGSLRPVCHACHERIEFDETGRKTAISTANHRIKARITRENQANTSGKINVYPSHSSGPLPTGAVAGAGVKR